MDGKTLMASMSYAGYQAPLSAARYDQLAGVCTAALREAGCDTVNRAAMFLAQIGCESGSLRWTEELADGSAYNYRHDLGNLQQGDGPRFKGRSLIQVTGRAHYAELSAWAHSKGYVPTADYFIQNPSALSQDRYAFLGPVWYWTVARRQMNTLADQRDIVGATIAVNGGTNALSDRTARWRHCLSLGNALLSPSPHVSTPSGEFVMDAEARKYLDAQFAGLDARMRAAVNEEVKRFFTSPDGDAHRMNAYMTAWFGASKQPLKNFPKL